MAVHGLFADLFSELAGTPIARVIQLLATLGVMLACRCDWDAASHRVDE